VAPLLRVAGMRHAFLVHATDIPESMCACLRGLAIVRVGEDGRLLDYGEQPNRPRRAWPERDRNAVTQLIYTSGSTGQPRGVMQTIENVAANTHAIVDYLKLGSHDRAMLILPLSYCYGKSVLQTHLLVGGSVFLDPRFMYPQLVLDAIGSERCTGFAGVPLTFELLQRQTKPDMTRLRSLRYVTQAGGAMTQSTTDWVRLTFAPAKLFTMYGQTEATARLSYLPPERADKQNSIGIPVSGVELRVVDEHGVTLPCGAQGQIVARGPSISPGYYRQPEATARILRDGWLLTGDIGYRDEEGFFFLVGREKEILKVGGHRVSPEQIETTLAECEGILEAAVVGVSDALMGEVPVALVVVKTDFGLGELVVRKFCAARLPAYMVPRQVAFTSLLPRGASGKLLRAEVRRLLAKDERETRSSI
jgi:acyl-CoA synthetase (AMP-forming)/AMP-acid ligase II